MISHKHKFIFVAIPKTGTTTISRVLYDNSDAIPNRKLALRKNLSKHLSLSQYHELFPKQTLSYFKFSFVRNPWSRVVSLYNRKEGIEMKNKMTFIEFVNWIELATDTCTRPTAQKNMLDFFKIDNELNMDFIGKLENIQEDFNYVCDKIEIPQQKLPHKNKTKHKHYTEYYDSETKQIVAEKFAKDIEYFGYKFED